jgi:hypothetical protein
MSIFKSIDRRGFGTLALAGLAATSLGSVPAQAATPDEIKARGKLTVGVIALRMLLRVDGTGRSRGDRPEGHADQGL